MMMDFGISKAGIIWQWSWMLHWLLLTYFGYCGPLLALVGHGGCHGPLFRWVLIIDEHPSKKKQEKLVRNEKRRIFKKRMYLGPVSSGRNLWFSIERQKKTY